MTPPLDTLAGHVVACPDGSVDSYTHLYDGSERLTSRDELASRLRSGERSFSVEPQRTVPGGQAVNVARQSHALGGDVTLFGHCGAETLSFPFSVESLGAPSRVTVRAFDGEDLMIADDPDAFDSCDAARLRQAGLYAAPADAVFVGNAVSVVHIPDILREFAAGETPVVFDPGPITGIAASRAETLCSALGDLADRRPVVVSPNAAETTAFAEALGLDAGGDVAPRLRDRLGIDAFVVHDHPTTRIITDEVRRLDTPNVERTSRTGGGDAFVGGLATGLASDWSVVDAARLGTWCTAHRVTGGGFGGSEAVASLRERVRDVRELLAALVQRALSQRFLVCRLTDEVRNGRRCAVLVERDERQEGGRRRTRLADAGVFCAYVDAHVDARLAGVEHVPLDDGHFAEVDGREEVDVVDRGGDTLIAGEPHRRDCPADIHPVEHCAAERASEVVRVVWQQQLRHLREGVGESSVVHRGRFLRSRKVVAVRPVPSI